MIICKCLLRAISLETKSKVEMTDCKGGDKGTVFVSQGEPGIISESFLPGQAQGKLQWRRTLGSQSEGSW